MSISATTILAMLKGFRCRPWSVTRAVVASLATGMAGALFHLFLYCVGPFELTYVRYVVPAVFWTSTSVAMWLLYHQVNGAEFRSNRRPLLNSILPLTLFVFGVHGAVWCYWHHICMAGHMAHPHPAWHYLVDAAWVASLTAGVVWAWRVRSILSLGLAAFAAFLVFFRFLLGSAGGMYGNFPL